MELVEVAVPVPLGQPFTYRCDGEELRGVAPGCRVLVPFGKRQLLAVVLRRWTGAPPVAESKLRSVLAVLDPTEPALPPELLRFLLALADYYLAPVGEVLRQALPALERADRLVVEAQGQSLGGERAVGRTRQRVHLRVGDEARELPRGAQGLAILQELQGSSPQWLVELEGRHGNARAAVKRLQQLGWVELREEPVEVDPFGASAPRDSPPELTSEQQQAVERVATLLDGGSAATVLLHGVTASGKTEVYLRAARQCQARGRGVIVLVPEIALTPQLVQRFRARLGDGIGVLHSGLTDVDRQAMWKRIRSGELRVVVGARSALLAPVQDLALICVDEEHDGSFKQEEGVRYHARDMAILRAHLTRGVTLLGSATPSLEAEHLVRSGRAERLRLTQRAVAAAVLPAVELVDLRRNGGAGSARLLTVPLLRALEEVLAARQQAILFLNRRGFAPNLVCEGCGAVQQCPSCSVSLTFHKAEGGLRRCHYCGWQQGGVAACSSCGGATVSLEGVGTERVEEELRSRFPSARVARLDRDVAAGLDSAPILDRMRRGEVDFLVGTQMVTKGHDLPQVSLVGVLNADAALGMPDFRAAERTFQLLVQVAGRAGRSETPGRVLVQTWNPSHPVLAHAVRHDVQGFLQREWEERGALQYPPHRRSAMVRFDGLEEGMVRAEATKVLRALGDRAPDLRALGPAPAPLARLRHRYRYQLLLLAKDRGVLRSVLRWVQGLPFQRHVRVTIDLDRSPCSET